jgi:hypothetical protein
MDTNGHESEVGNHNWPDGFPVTHRWVPMLPPGGHATPVLIRVNSYYYSEKFAPVAQIFQRCRTAAVPSRSGSAHSRACGLANPVFPSHRLRVRSPALHCGCGSAALGSFVVELPGFS